MQKLNFVFYFKSGRELTLEYKSKNSLEEWQEHIKSSFAKNTNGWIKLGSYIFRQNEIEAVNIQPFELEPEPEGSGIEIV